MPKRKLEGTTEMPMRKQIVGVADCLQTMFARRCKQLPQRKTKLQTNKVTDTTTVRKWKTHAFIYSNNDSDFMECSLESPVNPVAEVDPVAEVNPVAEVDPVAEVPQKESAVVAEPSPIVQASPSDEDSDSEETVVSTSFTQEGPALTFAQPDPETPPSESQSSWISWTSSDSQVRDTCTHTTCTLARMHTCTHTCTLARIHTCAHSCTHTLEIYHLGGLPPSKGHGHVRHSGHVPGHVRHCGGYVRYRRNSAVIL